MQKLTRTGLTLRSNIEEGLDAGKIVLVPLASTNGHGNGNETQWKCVLTDKEMANRMVYAGVNWKVSGNYKYQLVS